MCPESRRSRRRAGGGLDLEATASWKTDGRALDRDTGRTWKTDDGVEARRCGRRHAEPRTQRRIGGVAHGDLLHALGNQRVRAVLAGSRRSRNRSPACFATPRNAPPCRGRARIRVERYLRRSGLIVLVASVPRRGCYGRRPRHKLVARGNRRSTCPSPISVPNGRVLHRSLSSGLYEAAIDAKARRVARRRAPTRRADYFVDVRRWSHYGRLSSRSRVAAPTHDDRPIPPPLPRARDGTPLGEGSRDARGSGVPTGTRHERPEAHLHDPQGDDQVSPRPHGRRPGSARDRRLQRRRPVARAIARQDRESRDEARGLRRRALHRVRLRPRRPRVRDLRGTLRRDRRAGFQRPPECERVPELPSAHRNRDRGRDDLRHVPGPPTPREREPRSVKRRRTRESLRRRGPPTASRPT
jgi:hypothetical protein